MPITKGGGLATITSNVELTHNGSQLDYNYGAVSNNTLRTAAQLGNATGAAAFGAGATTAQVLRAVLASDQAATLAQETTLGNILTALGLLGTEATLGQVLTALGPLATEATLLNVLSALGPLATEATLQTLATEATLSSLNGKINSDFGASSGAARVAALLGNASGIADFNSGNVTAQTPRVVIATDQPAFNVNANVTQPAVTTSVGSATLTTGGVTIFTAGASVKRSRIQVFMGRTANTFEVNFRLNGTTFATGRYSATTPTGIVSPALGVLAFDPNLVSSVPQIKMIDVELAPNNVLSGVTSTGSVGVTYFVTNYF